MEYYFTPRERPVRSIVMFVSVCLSVRTLAYLENCTAKLHQMLCMLSLVVVQSSSGGVEIRYVLPVLWMTSRFHTIALWHVIVCIPKRR